MRVLFVSGLTAHGVGGAQVEAIKLANGIAACGIKTGIAIDRFVDFPNLEHFPLNYPPTKNSAEQLKSAVAAFQPDVVHVIGGGINFLRQTDAAVGEVPWVFTAHNVPPCERTYPGFYGHNILYYLARNMRGAPSALLWKFFLRYSGFRSVISHSHTVAARLQDFGCPQEKLLLVPFGVDMVNVPEIGNSPFPTDANPKILTVAGLINHKGLHDAINIMKTLRDRFSKVHYCIIGENRDRDYAAFLDRLIAKEKVGCYVNIVPNASEATKHAALRAADIYVQPSHEEGFCIAFAEAAAVVPRLVGTRTGEIAGLISDDALGILVDPKRPEALLLAIESVLNAEPAKHVMSLRHERLKQRYSWANYFDGHLEAYRALC
jgi:glycosyltransferase involved in cell wall biosynthesis